LQAGDEEDVECKDNGRTQMRVALLGEEVMKRIR
jgi:hypothetical protein